jgi:hypothetical protein
MEYKNNITETIPITRKDGSTYNLKPYFPDEKLRKAVNMAIAFKHALYFEWNIKSSSKVSDGIYTFDHIKRLRDAQLDQINKTKVSDNLSLYIEKGALAKSFEASKKGKPTILLIDEIDKADIDFPNDLLLELDQKRFEIPELKQNITAEESPIIFTRFFKTMLVSLCRVSRERRFIENS